MSKSSISAIDVIRAPGDCLVVAATTDGVALFDLFGELVYQLLYCGSSFPPRQVEITRISCEYSLVGFGYSPGR